MLDKDTINKLRKSTGGEVIGLIIALESLNEAYNTIDETSDKVKKILEEIEFVKTDIKIAKSRIMSYIRLTTSDNI